MSALDALLEAVTIHGIQSPAVTLTSNQLVAAAQKLGETCEGILIPRAKPSVYEVPMAGICKYLPSTMEDRFEVGAYNLRFDQNLLECFVFTHPDARGYCRTLYRLSLPSREQVFFSAQGDIVGPPVFNGSPEKLAALVDAAAGAIVLAFGVEL